mgnify:CR=1 FL=1
MKSKVFIAAVAVLALVSCAKKESQVGAGSNVGSFSEIKTPMGFDFSSTQTITVQLPKHEGVAPGTRSIITIEDAEGNALLKYNADLSQETTLPLELPATTDELFYTSTSGLRETIKISNKIATFK